MPLPHPKPPPSPSPPPPPSHSYTPIPAQHEENYIVLPFYHDPNHPHKWRIIIAVSLLLLAALVYFFWPSDPTLKIVRLRLNKIHVHTLPIISIDISLHLTIKVRNVDVYSLDFNSLDVAVRYRGKRLGHVRSDGGQVRALASSFVDAELEFRGVSVLSDVGFLLEDLARGTVPFDTVTQVTGKLGLLFFGFPLKAKMSCAILVNTTTKTIARQNCSPER